MLALNDLTQRSQNLLARFFGSVNERKIKAKAHLVARVNELEPEFEKKSDDEVRALTDAFKQRLSNGETLDDLLPEAFAAVREAAKRTLGQRHFDVQLVGGIMLHEGRISEMKTGEGKTLVATLPVYLNALAGKGVHVVTVNDYLAKRDSEWMGQIYKFLGLTIGVIVHGLTDEERRRAYACDVTYGTNNEYGFDYLRDNMKYSRDAMVQRGHHFAIVDEVDFDPDRRSAHAADHLRPHRGQFGTLQKSRQPHPLAGEGGFRARREAAAGDADRGRQRAHGAAAARSRRCSKRATSTTSTTSRRFTT